MMTVIIENRNSEIKAKELKNVASVCTQPVQTFMYVIKFKDGSEIVYPMDKVVVNKGE